MNKINELVNNPVFVIGYPKSGTTLLTSMLDNHRQLLVIPEETRVFSRVWQMITYEVSKNSNEYILPVDVVVEKLIAESNLEKFSHGLVANSIGGNFDYSDFEFPKFKEKLIQHITDNKLSEKNLLDGVLLAYMLVKRIKDTSNIKYWVEKTPRHYEHVSRIKELYPKAKFLHIVRDPRDNWSSYKKKKGTSKLPLLTFCYHWRNAYLLKESRELDENDYLKITFEDLVTKPRDVSNRICNFLDINFAEVLLQPTKNGKAWHGNSMWNEKNISISKNVLERYKKWPNQQEIHSIETVLGRLWRKNKIVVKLKYFDLPFWFRFKWFIFKQFLRDKLR